MDGVRGVLRVERGRADEEELAALAAVLLLVRSRSHSHAEVRGRVVAVGRPGIARRWREAGHVPPGSWR
ncbi:acyl-CoA carboxylase epsilon subunit [Streptomyces fructofermentans]|uniref:Acyl-CoA carboxylase subunit epsilon n=1 Tax=Streptomyces fructofermentans TaxID=152141 RepID=A0A918U6I0_9ACTN|nr:acyl-CoA carboxylase epsilon subunit [Streptomyces fructofermentans]GGX99622.1 hypothetical protein GCM10010515_77140 [Streptomyces fructofermentans]